MPRVSPSLRRAAIAVGVAGALAASAAAALAACDDDGGTGDSERFCGEVQEHFDELRSVPQTQDEVDELISLWTEVGESAPLAIEQDWDAVTLSLETATDYADQQDALARIFATERSHVAIAGWLDANCAIAWPVATIVAATTTTLLDGSTPSGVTTTSSTAG